MPPKRKIARKCNDTTAKSGEDRISDLPDDALLHVLSFLSAHDAVRTCVLSRRWRDVWKSTRVLRFNEAERWGTAARFNEFVNQMLFFRDLSPLEEFEFKTYRFWPSITSNAFSDPVEPVRYASMWINYALMRDVRVLRILVNSRDRILELFNQPFVSHHLTTLELKTVQLSGNSMDFSRFPALENLEMSDCLILVHMMSFHSLRRLSVSRCQFHNGICTRILAPNLLSFRLDVRGGRVPFLQSMPLLVTAHVSIGRFCSDRCWHSKNGKCSFDTCVDCYGYDAGSDGCLLLGGLSNATTLDLAADFSCSQHTGVTIFNRDMKLCSVLSNLKTLVLDGWALVREVDAIICFLCQTPNLEKLTLQLDDVLQEKFGVKIDESCSPLEKFVLPEHLQIVEVRCTKIVENVQKFVKILCNCGITTNLINIRETDS